MHNTQRSYIIYPVNCKESWPNYRCILYMLWYFQYELLLDVQTFWVNWSSFMIKFTLKILLRLMSECFVSYTTVVMALPIRIFDWPANFDGMALTSYKWHGVANRLFVQQLVQTNIKEKIRSPHYWLFWIRSTDDRRILLTKGQLGWHFFMSWCHCGVMPHTGISIMQAVTVFISWVNIEYNACTGVANCSWAHQSVILVFISRVAQQRAE